MDFSEYQQMNDRSCIVEVDEEYNRSQSPGRSKSPTIRRSNSVQGNSHNIDTIKEEQDDTTSYLSSYLTSMKLNSRSNSEA